ncbi:MAG: cytochrome c [Planctomycetales bacterium]|nr:cytochrome c [Planctomycetales bacterium]
MHALDWNRSWVRFALVALTCLGASACSQQPVAEFSYNAAVAELPELHQNDIKEGLRRLFGTSVAPRLRAVDPETPEPEEGEEWTLIDIGDEHSLKRGAAVYNARCAGCHGVTGDGAGPAGEHLRPRPRDYRKGVFKFTSTPFGMKPARHDLVRTIRRGAKGTSMPGFPWMSEADLNDVIDYVIYLSQRGEVEEYVTRMAQDEYDEGDNIDFLEFVDALALTRERWESAEDNVVLPLTAKPHYTEDSITEGRRIFLKEGCAKCHGVDGKGQVEWLNPEFLAAQDALPEDQREQINYDAWDEPAPAADLTARLLHGGRRPIDIYRRIYTGINGTPMPAFEALFASKPDEIWHVVHYVQHIIEGGDPLAGIPSLPPAEVVAPVAEPDSDPDADESADAGDEAEDAAAEEESTQAEDLSDDQASADDNTTDSAESADSNASEASDDDASDSDASGDTSGEASEKPVEEPEPVGVEA